MPGMEYSIFLLPNDVFSTEKSEHPESLKGGVPSSGRGRRCSRATYVAQFRGGLTCFLAVGKQRTPWRGGPDRLQKGNLINKLWDTHTGEYCSALKRNEVLTQATTWLNAEDIMLQVIGCNAYLVNNIVLNT